MTGSLPYLHVRAPLELSVGIQRAVVCGPSWASFDPAWLVRSHTSQPSLVVMRVYGLTSATRRRWKKRCWSRYPARGLPGTSNRRTAGDMVTVQPTRCSKSLWVIVSKNVSWNGKR